MALFLEGSTLAALEIPMTAVIREDPMHRSHSVQQLTTPSVPPPLGSRGAPTEEAGLTGPASRMPTSAARQAVHPDSAVRLDRANRLLLGTGIAPPPEMWEPARTPSTLRRASRSRTPTASAMPAAPRRLRLGNVASLARGGGDFGATTPQVRDRRDVVRAVSDMAAAVARSAGTASATAQPFSATLRANAACRHRRPDLRAPTRRPADSASFSASRAEDTPGHSRISPTSGASAKRRHAEDLEELDAHRKRIRTLEREKTTFQRRYRETRMNMAQRELLVQSLRDQMDSLQRELAQHREELDAARNKDRCIVCMTETASHVLVPCGHLAFCQECIGLASSRCPLCRQQAEFVVRVFRP